MDSLEVIARVKIRPGQLEGFKSQGAEILRATRERDTHTLRCDWFISEDGTQCEVHELFPDEQGLIEHKMNTMEATAVLFRDYAFDHHATIYGEVSQGFIDLVTERMGPPTVFAFTQGLESPDPALRLVRQRGRDRLRGSRGLPQRSGAHRAQPACRCGEGRVVQGLRLRPSHERLRRDLATTQRPLQEARRRSKQVLLRPGARTGRTRLATPE